MGLRDFLLGAQQFREGAAQLGEAQDKRRQRLAAEELRANIESQYGPEFAQIFGQAQESGVQPVVSEGAKVLFESLKKDKGMDGALSPEALKLAAPGATEEEINIAAGLSGKAQKEAIAGLREKYKQGQVSERQAKQLGIQERKFKISNFKDLNKSLQDQEVKFDDATKGLRSSLAQFKQNPNKSSLQQLAVSMARAGGDTGVLSNQDLAAYKLSTVAQDFESLQAYLTDTPEEAITPSVKQALVQMAEFGLNQADSRKKGRLRSLYENGVSTLGEELMRGKDKPEVMKTWEKRLGVEAKKTDQGLEISRRGGSFKGRKAEIMQAAAATGNQALIRSVEQKLSQLPEDKDIGDKAFDAFMQRIRGGK